MDYDLCSTHSTDSKIVVQENRSRFEVVNNNRYQIKKVVVDGCLISDHREKCDFIIEIKGEGNKKRALFIELKGCNILKAISQLKSTLIHTQEKYINFSKECFAVTTRFPKSDTSSRKMCIDFHKSTNVSLSIRNLNISILA